jgi:hypothetical protein
MDSGRVRYPCARESRVWPTLAVAALWASGAHAERRVAQVIGNGAYKNAPRLPNPGEAFAAISALARRAGQGVSWHVRTSLALTGYCA